MACGWAHVFTFKCLFAWDIMKFVPISIILGLINQIAFLTPNKNKQSIAGFNVNIQFCGTMRRVEFVVFFSI